jgi:oligosaccharide repeat unit polymerase
MTYFHYIKNKDIFSPSVIVCGSFLIAVICTIVNINAWGVDLQIKTCMIILIGLFSFIMGDKLSLKRYSIVSTENPIRKNEVIDIPKYKTLIVILVDIIIVYFFYRDVIRIANIDGSIYFNYQEMIAIYRVNMMFSNDIETTFNPILRQLIKPMVVVCYIYLFAFINNIIIDRKWRKYILYLFPILITIIYIMFSGSRIGLIRLFVATLFIIYILKIAGYQSNYDNKIVKKKFIRNLLVLVISFLFLFYSVRILVGRSSYKDTPFFDYISMYIAASIQLFDQYITSPNDYVDVSNQILDESLFGKETFVGIHSMIAKFNGKKINKGLEFRESPTGIRLGNIYTPFRRYYNDFGLTGIIICPFIIGLFYSFLYRKIQYFRNFSNKKMNFYIILYSYVLYGIVVFAMDDVFFPVFVTGSFLEEVIIMYVLYSFLFLRKYGVKRITIQ